MRKPETRTIEGTNYEVTPLGPDDTLLVLRRLTKAAGPALSQLATAAAAAGGSLGSVGGELVLGELGAVAERLTDDDLLFVRKLLSKHTEVHHADGRKQPLDGIYNLHFEGEIVAFFGWLVFGLEVTFAPLGRALSARAKARVPAPASSEKASSPSISPSTSSG